MSGLGSAEQPKKSGETGATVVAVTASYEKMRAARAKERAEREKAADERRKQLLRSFTSPGGVEFYKDLRGRFTTSNEPFRHDMIEDLIRRGYVERLYPGKDVTNGDGGGVTDQGWKYKITEKGSRFRSDL